MPRNMKMEHFPESIFSSLTLNFPMMLPALLKEGLQSHRVTSDLRQQVSLALERQLSGQLANSYASSLINLPLASPAAALNTLPSFPAKSSSKQHPPLTASNSVANCNAASHLKTVALKEHRKLDRSVSEPVDKSQQALRQAPPSSSRYKTELCRPYEENGTCKYGDKCQFAHGIAELRSLSRHPKYKTELCRTFHSTGFCPYGPRCHFIHNSEEAKKYFLDSLQGSGRVQGQQTPPLSPVYHELEFGGIDYYPNRYLQPGSEGDLSPNSSSCSSGSPTSSMGGFFLDDHAMPTHSEATPSTTNRGNYTPVKPLAVLPTLIPKSGVSPPSPISEDEVLITLDNLVSNFEELDCKVELPLSDAECPARPEPSAAVDIKNIRLPIFSKLSHGNSP